MVASAAGAADAWTKEPRVIEEYGFLVYDLHRRNLKLLPNGDFIFRLAEDVATGTVYWAYMGTTADVVAVVTDPDIARRAEDVRQLMLRVAELPKRVGCGVGLIHTSTVYVVPTGYVQGESDAYLDLRPLYATGVVQSDETGRAPVRLLAFKMDPYSEK